MLDCRSGVHREQADEQNRRYFIRILGVNIFNPIDPVSSTLPAMHVQPRSVDHNTLYSIQLAMPMRSIDECVPTPLDLSTGMAQVIETVGQNLNRST